MIGFMAAAQLFAVVAVHFHSTEVTGQRRATKFVVKRRAAQRTFGHDIQRSDNTFRLAKILFPRLHQSPEYAGWKRRSPTSPAFGFRATPGGAFITNFAAGTGRRPGHGEIAVAVMRFDLTVNAWALMKIVTASIVIGEVAPHRVILPSTSAALSL